MSGIIALESYVKEIGGGSDSAVPLKCCTKSRAIGFGCAAAPLTGYSDNQLVKVSDIETGVYVTELKVYHHRGSETGNTFDNYEEITEFIHSDMFGRGVPSLYANEFVVEAVYSSGTVENVSHRVTVHRINTGSVAESFQSVELTDGTESVVAYTNPSITHGYKYSFSFGGVTKTIDGWVFVRKEQKLEIGDAGSSPYTVVPRCSFNSNEIYVYLSMRIANNESNPGYGLSRNQFSVYGSYTIDGKYLNAGVDCTFNCSSSLQSINLDLIGTNYTSIQIYSGTFTDYNSKEKGYDKIKDSDIEVSIGSGDIATCSEYDSDKLTLTYYVLRSSES